MFWLATALMLEYNATNNPRAVAIAGGVASAVFPSSR
jgi:hypothetical protein